MSTVKVVSAVFHRSSPDGLQQILIFRRGPQESGAGSWEFPGGKVENGETDHGALAREIDEELGVQVNIGEWIGENLHQYPKKKIRLVAYATTFVDENVSFRLTDHDAFEWVTQADLSKYNISPADIPLVSAAFTYLKKRLTSYPK